MSSNEFKTPLSTSIETKRDQLKKRKRKGYSMTILSDLSYDPANNGSEKNKNNDDTICTTNGKQVSTTPSKSRQQNNPYYTSKNSLSRKNSLVKSPTPRTTMNKLQRRNISPLHICTNNVDSNMSSNSISHKEYTSLSSPSGSTTLHFYSPTSSTCRNNSITGMSSTASSPRIISQGSSNVLNEDNINADNIKILLLGDAGVGKTALILRYCNELRFIKKKPSSSFAYNDLYNNDNYQLPKIDEGKSSTHSGKLRNNITFDNTPTTKEKKLKTLTRKQKCYSLNDYEELFINQSDVLKQFNNDENDEDDDVWELSTQSTIGLDIKSQLINLDNRFFKILFWDTAGQERFRHSLNPLLYKKTQGLVLVYDICSIASLNSLMTYWIPEWIKNNPGIICRCFLIGNKVDLYKKRQVTHETVLKFVHEAENSYKNTLFIRGNFEISCKWQNNDGVEQCFSRIIQDLVSHGCYDVQAKPTNDYLMLDGVNGETSDDATLVTKTIDLVKPLSHSSTSDNNASRSKCC
ncbi:Rab family GTPase YPT11 SCDLUD_005030 [Saccharomycodes ludwigii]|uniref:Rab family GTPase YPT11 n=1 Tax=Saccharomycodes ludwigii TaxID=36035 RepID=UPI001E85D1EB|nr:hypothetical protein SCDLUD_005030 [Saccharomycodes ludwigii]KAH3898706.1 hypothetical protein SCDLUD_005030 [Saccharomycodes ludwigii]